MTRDQLKAVGAAAASTGSVALFHVVGVTPEAPSLEAATGGVAPRRTVVMTSADLRNALERLSTVAGTEAVEAVAVGSPHFSLDEFEELAALLDSGERVRIPFFVCTARDTLAEAERRGLAERLTVSGIDIVVDTCVVVTPILPASGGTLMTNSGKFAHYGPSETGYEVVYGSLADCVRSAVSGRVVRDEGVWAW